MSGGHMYEFSEVSLFLGSVFVCLLPFMPIYGETVVPVDVKVNGASGTMIANEYDKCIFGIKFKGVPHTSKTWKHLHNFFWLLY